MINILFSNEIIKIENSLREILKENDKKLENEKVIEKIKIENLKVEMNSYSSFQPTSFNIAIISIAYFPFYVLVMASSHCPEQVFECEQLSEPLTLHSICCQQIGACLFFGKEENLWMTKVIEDNP